MVVTNNTNKTSADDLAALLRGSSAAAKTTATKDTSAAIPADRTNRGPAVQIDLSALSDLMTRAQALDALKSNSDDTAKILSGQAQAGDEALNTLDQPNKSTAADRKVDAEKKLEAARKKLQLLQILGDPKTLASEAKQISKDIKDAATEYTKALKDGASSSPAAAGAVPGDPTTATIGSPASDARNDTASVAAQGAASTAVGSPADTAKATGDADKVQAQAAQPQAPDVSRADQAAINVQKYKDGQHDRDVLASFKQAANEVKQALQLAAQKLKAKNAADPEVKTITPQTKEMDKAVEALSETIRIQQSGGDISEPSDHSGTTTPSVDFLA
jgi:hypothetical protein